MSDLIQLEKNLFKSPKSARAADLLDLAKHYLETAGLKTDIKEKWKTLDKAGYFAKWVGEVAEATLGEVEEGYALLVKATQHPEVPEYAASAKPRMVKRILELKGVTDVKVLAEKKGWVAVESGVMRIGDKDWRLGDNPDMDRLVETVDESGRAVAVEVGGDGSFNVVVRLVEGKVPAMEMKEYKGMISSSGARDIKISSGGVGAADLWGDSEVILEVENGNYKMEVFLIERGKFYGCVAVVCKA